MVGGHASTKSHPKQRLGNSLRLGADEVSFRMLIFKDEISGPQNLEHLRLRCVATPLAAQLIEQRPGVLQISRVETLGEPVVDLGQRRARLVTPIGVAQQSREAGRHAQLPGFCVLSSSNISRSAQALFRLSI